MGKGQCGQKSCWPNQARWTDRPERKKVGAGCVEAGEPSGEGGRGARAAEEARGRLQAAGVGRGRSAGAGEKTGAVEPQERPGDGVEVARKGGTEDSTGTLVVRRARLEKFA